MIARAPGKAFVTGAYAVLEGAPAVVLAVDRFVEARVADRPASSTPAEVAVVARLLDVAAPHVDAAALTLDGRKLGLGSSAAAAVAAAAVILSQRGVAADVLPARAFAIAHRAHAEVQPRGSGGDVAASAFGTVVVRRRGAELEVERASVPPALVVSFFATTRAASTAGVLDRVAARRREPPVDRAFSALAEAAASGARAFSAADLSAFLSAAAAHVVALSALGAAVDLPLVPPEVDSARRLLDEADVRDDASRSIVLLPTGAGMGDTVLWLGARAPSDDEIAAFARVGLAHFPAAPIAHGVELVGGA